MVKIKEAAFKKLEKKIGYEFTDGELLLRALTHSSYANEPDVGDVDDNETLEFLGDTILSFIVSLELFQRYPGVSEGQLSKMKSFLVCASNLARIGSGLKLGRYLRLGRGEKKSGGQEKESLIANTVEALVAAVYLDGGLPRTSEVVVGLFEKQISDVGSSDRLKDYKSSLQELLQSRGESIPHYKVCKELGPDHDKTFIVEVVVPGGKTYKGKGKSKKEAHQKAARKALELSKGRRENTRRKRGPESKIRSMPISEEKADRRNRRRDPRTKRSPRRA